MDRLSDGRPVPGLGRERPLVELDGAAGVGALDTEDRLGQGRLAGTRLAHQAEGLAVEQVQVDLDERRERRGRAGGRSWRRSPSDRARSPWTASRPATAAGSTSSPIRSMWWQRVHRPPPTSTTGGSTVRHRSVASGQRSTNTQVGRFVPIWGRLPGIVASARWRLAHAMARERSKEPERVRVLRPFEDRRRVPLLHDLAGVHDPDPVAQRPDDAEVVGDEQDRGVGLGLEGPHEVQHARLDGRVEPGRRLVEDEQLGVRGKGDRDDDALLHPAGQLVRVALEHPLRVGDLDPLERLERVRRGLGLGLAQDRERLDDLWADPGRRIEGRARVLVDHRGVTHPELAHLLVVHRRHVGAADQDPTTGDQRVARQVADRGVRRRGLATAGLADQSVRLARADLERHAAQDRSRDPAHHVRQREVLDLEGGGRRGGRRRGSERLRGHRVTRSGPTGASPRSG